MAETLSGLLEEFGWQVEVDEAAGELQFRHYKTDATIVLDAEGNLTVPGGGEIGGEINELQSLLASALEEYGSAEPQQPCSIDCDEQVTIASAEGISLDAPTIELAADTQIEVVSGGSVGVDSDGNMDLVSSGDIDMDSSGNMALESGGSMDLNSSGNLTAAASAIASLRGALIELN